MQWQNFRQLPSCMGSQINSRANPKLYLRFAPSRFFRRKRLVKSPKLYFVDVGLAAWLLGLETPAQIERDPLRGMLYENLLIMEVVKNRLNQGKEPQLYFFRDSKGNEVDLLITSAGRSFTAIEIKSAATFQPEFVKGINVFRQSVGEDITVEAMVWYNGHRKTTYQDTIISNPLMHSFSPSG